MYCSFHSILPKRCMLQPLGQVTLVNVILISVGFYPIKQINKINKTNQINRCTLFPVFSFTLLNKKPNVSIHSEA